MKRVIRAFLLAGTPFFSVAGAGGGGAPVSELARPLLGLKGRAFDLAWLDAMRSQQEILAGLSEMQRLHGQKPALKNWAASDKEQRLARGEQLQALKNQLKPPTDVTHTDVVVAIANSSDKDLLTRFDPFFLSEYPKQVAQSTALARLALGRSTSAIIREEAAAVLAYETARMNELRKFK
ncbi:hypothetical protein ACINK0_04880 [Deinococcus sp. VB343]|uniref:hypothetical protein n=1 Tax=Deinococcus sp. VB343 TaxID=3385567 RepID=UPI0039C98381